MCPEKLPILAEIDREKNSDKVEKNFLQEIKDREEQVRKEELEMRDNFELIKSSERKDGDLYAQIEHLSQESHTLVTAQEVIDGINRHIGFCKNNPPVFSSNRTPWSIATTELNNIYVNLDRKEQHNFENIINEFLIRHKFVPRESQSAKIPPFIPEREY